MLELKYTDWSEVYSLSWKLGEIIVGAFIPNAIVAVARGGLIVGRLLADYFLLTDFHVAKLEFWGPEAKSMSNAKITVPLTVSLQDLKILVVDEVAGTGETLQVAKQHAYDRGADTVFTASLQCNLSTVKVKPDFCAEEYASEAWATYPWAITEDLRRVLDVDTLLREIYTHGSIERVCDYLFEVYGLELPEEVAENTLRRLCTEIGD